MRDAASARFHALTIVAIGALGGCSSFKMYDAAAAGDGGNNDVAADLANENTSVVVDVTDRHADNATDLAVDAINDVDVVSALDVADQDGDAWCHGTGLPNPACYIDALSETESDDSSVEDASADEVETGPTCEVDTCTAATSASCDLADGLEHIATFDETTDSFAFACASITPGARVFRLTLSTYSNVTIRLTVTPGDDAAMQVYTSVSCGTSDRLSNSCITTTGTGSDALNMQPAGTYYVVVKAAMREPVTIQATIQ